MLLKSLLINIDYRSKGNLEQDIDGIASDSRKVEPNFLFIALKGEKFDGHDFVREAFKKGATATIVNYDSKVGNYFSNKVVIKVKDTRDILSKIAENFYHNPNRYLDLVGVTGTNGKTTISYLIEAITKKANYKPSVIGTINYRIGNRQIYAQNTTPDPITIYRYMRELSDMGYDLLIIEASSHGLAQKRLNRLRFKSAIFTNLSEEHLDYHKDIEDYFSAKKILFKQVSKDGFAVINIDDSFGKRLWRELTFDRISYGIEEKADIKAENINMSLLDSRFKVKIFDKEIFINSNLLGIHNIYNILAAVAFAYKYGIKEEIIKEGIESLELIPGRMERVMGSTKLDVFVDYAHTPQALENVLLFISKFKQEKLWLIFGCGGDRFKGKRPIMGRIASRYADYIILTSDNPRNENPSSIIDEIKEGIDKDRKYWCIPNRREAILKAVEEAKHGDFILIAGKGHERYQIIGKNIISFDDREIASNLLIKRTVREMIYAKRD
jgi:UDP-N-acetylmuramoyl-L-alanyl-D-glutamate--2,6-diaminopimelate ligase